MAVNDPFADLDKPTDPFADLDTPKPVAPQTDQTSGLLRQAVADPGLMLGTGTANVLKGGLHLGALASDVITTPARTVMGKMNELMGIDRQPMSAPASKMISQGLEASGFNTLTDKVKDLYSPEQKAATAKAQAVTKQVTDKAIAEGASPFGEIGANIKGTAQGIVQNPRAAVPFIVENIPQLAGIAGASRLALGTTIDDVAAKVAQKTITKAQGDEAIKKAAQKVSTGIEGGFVAGAVASEIAEKDPNADLLHRMAAIPAGLIGAGISRATGKLTGMDNIEGQLATKGITNPTTSKLVNAGKGALTEGVLQEPWQEGQEQIWTNIGTKEPWQRDVGEGIVTGAVAGGGMGAGGGLLTGGKAKEDPTKSILDHIEKQKPSDLQLAILRNSPDQLEQIGLTPDHIDTLLAKRDSKSVEIAQFQAALDNAPSKTVRDGLLATAQGAEYARRKEAEQAKKDAEILGENAVPYKDVVARAQKRQEELDAKLDLTDDEAREFGLLNKAGKDPQRLGKALGVAVSEIPEELKKTPAKETLYSEAVEEAKARIEELRLKSFRTTPEKAELQKLAKLYDKGFPAPDLARQLQKPIKMDPKKPKEEAPPATKTEAPPATKTEAPPATKTEAPVVPTVEAPPASKVEAPKVEAPVAPVVPTKVEAPTAPVVPTGQAPKADLTIGQAAADKVVPETTYQGLEKVQKGLTPSHQFQTKEGRNFSTKTLEPDEIKAQYDKIQAGYRETPTQRIQGLNEEETDTVRFLERQPSKAIKVKKGAKTEHIYKTLVEKGAASYDAERDIYRLNPAFSLKTEEAVAAEKAKPAPVPTKMAPVTREDKPLTVYHGTSGQPHVGDKTAPYFTSVNKEDAQWFADDRGEGAGRIEEHQLQARQVLDLTKNDSPLLEVAKEQNVKIEGDLMEGTFFAPEINEVSTQEGTNLLDLLYIPRVREALVAKGYDVVRANDPLSNDETETYVVLNPKAIVTPKPAVVSAKAKVAANKKTVPKAESTMDDVLAEAAAEKTALASAKAKVAANKKGTVKKDKVVAKSNKSLAEKAVEVVTTPKEKLEAFAKAIVEKKKAKAKVDKATAKTKAEDDKAIAARLREQNTAREAEEKRVKDEFYAEKKRKKEEALKARANFAETLPADTRKEYESLLTDLKEANTKLQSAGRRNDPVDITIYQKKKSEIQAKILAIKSVHSTDTKQETGESSIDQAGSIKSNVQIEKNNRIANIVGDIISLDNLKETPAEPELKESAGSRLNKLKNEGKLTPGLRRFIETASALLDRIDKEQMVYEDPAGKEDDYKLYEADTEALLGDLFWMPDAFIIELDPATLSEDARNAIAPAIAEDYQIAEAFNQLRRDAITKVSTYFGSNLNQNVVDDPDNQVGQIMGLYTQEEGATIIAELLKTNYFYKDGKVMSEKITPSTIKPESVFSGAIAAAAVGYLRKGYGAKAAYKQAVADVYANQGNVHRQYGISPDGWHKFERGTDPEPLAAIAATSPGGWCTGYGAAGGQIARGDFYIYSEAGVAKIAIRMDGDEVAEASGSMQGQYMTEEEAQEAIRFAKEKGLEEDTERGAIALIKKDQDQHKNILAWIKSGGKTEPDFKYDLRSEIQHGRRVESVFLNRYYKRYGDNQVLQKESEKKAFRELVKQYTFLKEDDQGNIVINSTELGMVTIRGLPRTESITFPNVTSIGELYIETEAASNIKIIAPKLKHIATLDGQYFDLDLPALETAEYISLDNPVAVKLPSLIKVDALDISEKFETSWSSDRKTLTGYNVDLGKLREVHKLSFSGRNTDITLESLEIVHNTARATKGARLVLPAIKMGSFHVGVDGKIWLPYAETAKSITVFDDGQMDAPRLKYLDSLHVSSDKLAKNFKVNVPMLEDLATFSIDGSVSLSLPKVTDLLSLTIADSTHPYDFSHMGTINRLTVSNYTLESSKGTTFRGPKEISSLIVDKGIVTIEGTEAVGIVKVNGEYDRRTKINLPDVKVVANITTNQAATDVSIPKVSELHILDMYSGSTVDIPSVTAIKSLTVRAHRSIAIQVLKVVELPSVKEVINLNAFGPLQMDNLERITGKNIQRGTYNEGALGAEPIPQSWISAQPKMLIAPKLKNAPKIERYTSYADSRDILEQQTFEEFDDFFEGPESVAADDSSSTVAALEEALTKEYGETWETLKSSGQVVVVQSVADALRVHGARSTKSSNPQALYNPATGISTIIADNTDVKDVIGVLTHEVSVHGIADTNLDNRALELYKQHAKTKFMQAVAERLEDGGIVAEENPNEVRAYIVEEALNRSGHKELDSKFWQWARWHLPKGVVNWLQELATTIKSALTKAGLMTDRDLNVADLVNLAKANVAVAAARGVFPTISEDQVQESLGGPKAKGADLGALQKAKELLKNGNTPEWVYRRTGWFNIFGDQPHFGDNWVFEIPNTRFVNLKPGSIAGPSHMPALTDKYRRVLDVRFNTPIRLKDLIHAPEIFKNYPQIKNTKVTFIHRQPQPGQSMDQYPASYYADTAVIGVTSVTGHHIEIYAPYPWIPMYDIANMESTLVHEIQHAIQEVENSVRGSSPESTIIQMAVQNDIADRQDALEKLILAVNHPAFTDLILDRVNEGRAIGYHPTDPYVIGNAIHEYEQQSRLIINNRFVTRLGQPPMSAYNLYRRFGGEIEARLAQEQLTDEYSVKDNLPLMLHYMLHREDLIPSHLTYEDAVILTRDDRGPIIINNVTEDANGIPTKYGPVAEAKDITPLYASEVSDAADAKGFTTKAYHGTSAKFDELGNRGGSTNTREASLAWFFTDSLTDSKGFGELASRRMGGKAEVIPVRLNTSNFNTVDLQGHGGREADGISMAGHIENAIKDGKDGVIFLNARDTTRESRVTLDGETFYGDIDHGDIPSYLEQYQEGETKAERDEARVNIQTDLDYHVNWLKEEIANIEGQIQKDPQGIQTQIREELEWLKEDLGPWSELAEAWRTDPKRVKLEMPERATVYAVVNKNMVKSARTRTTSKGQEVPLAQRFDSSSPSFKHSEKKKLSKEDAAAAKVLKEIFEPGKRTMQETISDVIRDAERQSSGPVAKWFYSLTNRINAFARDKNNQNSTFWDRYISSPEFYFPKTNAGGAILNAAVDDASIKYSAQKRIVGDFLDLATKVLKHSPAAYKAANNYMLKTDKTGIGFKLRENKENGEWLVLDRKDKVVFSSPDEQFAQKQMLDMEQEWLKSQLMHPDAMKLILEARKLTGRAFDILVADMRAQINRAKENGNAEPTAIFVDDAGKSNEVSLSELIAQMGDLRGTYFPRERVARKFHLIAEQEGKPNILETFDWHLIDDESGMNTARVMKRTFNNAMPAGRRFNELLKQGYKFENVRIKPVQSPSELLFDLPGVLQSVDAIFSTATEKMNIDSLEEADRLWLGTVDKALALRVADIYKAKGNFSSRMSRAEKVWEGYETDMIRALTGYGTRVSTGVAKRTTARKMIEAITGRTISWKQYQQKFPEAKYPEYLEFVKSQRISPTKQKEMYVDLRQYIEFFLKPDDLPARLVGYIKAGAVLKYLGFRVSSAAINMTNLVMSVPATITAHTGGNLAQTSGAIYSATKDLIAYKHNMLLNKGWKFLGRPMKLSEESFHAIETIIENGWAEAQFNHDAAQAMTGMVGREMNNVMAWAMLMFGATEKANRAVTILAGFNQLSKHGLRLKDGTVKKRLSTGEKLSLAKHASDRAHGIYGKAAKPYLVQKHRFLDAPYTFQKFQHTYHLNMLELTGKYKSPGMSAFMTLSPQIFAGTSVAATLGFMVASAMGVDDPEESYVSALAKFLGDSEFARDFAQFGIVGAVFGINLKGSLEAKSPFPSTLGELFGAPQSVFVDIKDGIAAAAAGQGRKSLEHFLPSAFGSPLKGYREMKEGLTKKNYAPVIHESEYVHATAADFAIRVMSFNPTRLSDIRNSTWREDEVRRAYQNDRGEITTRYNQLIVQGISGQSDEWADFWKDVAKYNERAAMAKPEYRIPLIGADFLLQQEKRSFKPNKYNK